MRPDPSNGPHSQTQNALVLLQHITRDHQAGHDELCYLIEASSFKGISLTVLHKGSFPRRSDERVIAAYGLEARRVNPLYRCRAQVRVSRCIVMFRQVGRDQSRNLDRLTFLHELRRGGTEACSNVDPSSHYLCISTPSLRSSAT